MPKTMMKKQRNRASQVLPRIKAMEVGDDICFPIEWMDTVRAQTSKCNLLFYGERSTRVSRDDRKIYVTRTE